MHRVNQLHASHAIEQRVVNLLVDGKAATRQAINHRKLPQRLVQIEHARMQQCNQSFEFTPAARRRQRMVRDVAVEIDILDLLPLRRHPAEQSIAAGKATVPWCGADAVRPQVVDQSLDVVLRCVCGRPVDADAAYVKRGQVLGQQHRGVLDAQRYVCGHDKFLELN